MKKMLSTQKRFWAQIDLDAVKYNFLQAKKAIKVGVKICCVIKANAYGHGAVALARFYERIGADYFAVSNIEEALELRMGGVKKPILVLAYTNPECAAIIAENDIEQCVYSTEYAKALAAVAEREGVKVKVHIKLDTGMRRLGFLVDDERDELEEALSVCKLPSFITTGVFSHFAHADGGDAGDEFTAEQARKFAFGVRYLEERGVRFSVKHLSNSAAAYEYPEHCFDMVRMGISLCGEPTSPHLRRPLDLKTTMTLRTIVSNVKTVLPGETVGYSRTFTAKRETRIAVVPMGYADGIFRRSSQEGLFFTVNGKPAPLIGRVCMDQTVLDVTDIEGVELGTPVTIFGTGALLSVNEAGDILGTINCEMFTNVSRRVPRVYIENGEISEVVDYLI